MFTPPGGRLYYSKNDLSPLLTDIHGAGPADSLPAAPPEGEARVHLVLDLDQGVQHLNRKHNSQIHKLYIKRMMKASLHPTFGSPWARSC